MKTLVMIAALLIQAEAVQSRPGTIAGQIRNPGGAPAAGVRVIAIDATPLAAETIVSLTQTDDSGRYRLEDVPPGPYYVAGGALESLSYYPGTAQISGATAVTVSSGSILSGMDFVTARFPFTVSGRIRWEGRTPPASALISLSSGQWSFDAPVASDGTFELRNVKPGHYFITIIDLVIAATLHPESFGGPAFVPVFPNETIVSDDARLEVLAPKTADFTGTVRVEDGGPEPDFAVRFAGKVEATAAVRQGAFHVTLPAGSYRVSTVDLPGGFALKSITSGNSRAGADDGFSLALPDAPAVVHVNLAAGAPAPSVAVSGHVAGIPSGVSGISVLLTDISRSGISRPFSHASVRSGRDVDIVPVNAAGDFKFPKVMPGRYAATVRVAAGVGVDVTTTVPVPVIVESATRGDIHGVSLTIPAQKEVRGRIQVEGNEPVPNFDLEMTVDGYIRSIAHVRPDPDGNFKVTLAVGERDLDDVSHLPPGYHWVSKHYGTMNLIDSPLHVLTGDSSELLLRLDAASSAVRVGGRLSDIPIESLRDGQARIELKSASYAGTVETKIQPDGGFEFTKVFPGIYTARVTGPGIGADVCAPLVVAEADLENISLSPKTAPEIQIASAIFAASGGAVDVTPRVAQLTKPGLNEFYAAPAWLRVDPSFGEGKSLLAQYQFRCRNFFFYTDEPGAVSHDILVSHAESQLSKDRWNGPSFVSERPLPLSSSVKPLAPSPDDFTIVEAYYGEGAQYVSVTSAVRDRLKSGAPDFVIDNAMFGVNRDSPYFEFVLTYLYRGKRSVLTAEKGEPVTLELLAANAFQGSLPRNGDEAPLEWLLAMRPDPPLDPDITGPGTGPEPRKELGIVTLIRALGELNAVEPRFSQMASELAPLVRRAIADAEANIEYPFPPASMKPPALARLEDDETRLGKAVRSLFEARMLLGAADPGRNADALAGALDKIDQALAIIDSR